MMPAVNVAGRRRPPARLDPARRLHRDRILLTELTSVEWRSLTFVGERHQLTLRIAGADAGEIASRITTGLGDAEFAICGHVVADIACEGRPQPETDGSVTLRIEALTIEN